MRNEFMLAINQVCAERQLAKEVVLEAVEAALVTAYRRNFGAGGNITARIDPETGAAHVYTGKIVSETVEDPKTEISLQEARALAPDAELGQIVLIESTPKEFGRIAAQTAKQVILQRIREAERDALYGIYAEQEGELVNGTVQSIDSQVVIVNLGKAEGTLPRSEQIPGERYRLNQRLRAYVMEVEKSSRGPRIILSRNHRNMLRRLMELEVPEIFNGSVEIKAIAREPGARSKVAVVALRPGVDAVGSCVGMRGARIQGIVSELNGEKIDIVEWNADESVFIANALSPAQVVNVHLAQDLEGGKTATVIVPDKQLSLAIGKEGQNARLAAKLTGWRIDIKSASEAAAEVFAIEEKEPEPARDPFEDDLLSRAEAILAARKAAAAEEPAAEDIEAAEEALEEEPAAPVAESEEPALAAEAAADVQPADTAEAGVESEAETEETLEVAGVEATASQEELEEEPEAEEVGSEAGEAPADIDVELELEEVAEELEQSFETWLYEDEDEEDEAGPHGKKKKKHRQKKQAMVFDEAAGRVVAKRKRKPSRRREPWEDEY